MSNKGTLTIEIDNTDGGVFKYTINPVSLEVYYMMQKLQQSGKTLEGYVAAIKTLKVEGDDPSILLTDPKYMPCLMALDGILGEMMKPAEFSIKKN